MIAKMKRMFCLVLILLLPAHVAFGQDSAKSNENDYSLATAGRVLGFVWGGCMSESYGERSKALSDPDKAWQAALKLCEPEQVVMQRFIVRAGATSAQAGEMVRRMIEGLKAKRPEILKNYNAKRK